MTNKIESFTPLHDRDGQIWLDGQMVPWRSAHTHILSHGLHYASSVFEGMRAYNGVIFKLKEHVDRLFRSAEILSMEIPYSSAQIEEASLKLISSPGLENSYIRPVVWRGAESMGIGPGDTQAHVAIAAWQLPAYFSMTGQIEGIHLTISEWKRPPPYTVPWQAKAAGLYMISTLAKERAEKNGFDDALMLNWLGQIAETTSANIFFVIDGALHTPLPSCFLDGITRQTVIALTRKRGIKVIERNILPPELEAAQEIFVTGTAAEITPVCQIDAHHYRVGKITKQLQSDYALLCKGASLSLCQRTHPPMPMLNYDHKLVNLG